VFKPVFQSSRASGIISGFLLLELLERRPYILVIILFICLDGHIVVVLSAMASSAG